MLGRTGETWASGNLRPSAERHLRPDFLQQVMVDHGGGNCGLIIGVAELGHDHTPGIDNHAMAVAEPLFVVPSNL